MKFRPCFIMSVSSFNQSITSYMHLQCRWPDLHTGIAADDQEKQIYYFSAKLKHNNTLKGADHLPDLFPPLLSHQDLKVFYQVSLQRTAAISSIHQHSKMESIIA